MPWPAPPTGHRRRPPPPDQSQHQRPTLPATPTTATLGESGRGIPARSAGTRRIVARIADHEHQAGDPAGPKDQRATSATPGAARTYPAATPLLTWKRVHDLSVRIACGLLHSRRGSGLTVCDGEA